MDAKRLNVAISRPKKKRIVVGAASLFRLLPSDPDIFEQASIWKVLRFAYSDRELWVGETKEYLRLSCTAPFRKLTY